MIALQVLLVVLLAGLSIFLSSVQAAFHLLKRRRLTQVGFRDEARIELAQRYLDDPARMLMPVQLGTYTAHVCMTVIITSLAFRLVDHWAMLTAFGVMMAYLLLFRVSMPYILVRQDPEAAFLKLLPAFHLWAQALDPLVSRLRRRAAPDPDEAEEGGPVPEVPPPPVQQVDEERLVDALDRFSGTLAREIMTPRLDVVAIEAKAPVSALRRLMGETKYSRIPVYGKDLDDIVGVVEVRDLLDFQGDAEAAVGPLARPTYLVPETKRIPELLREMQGRRLTFAVVIDEYGGTAGIVTVEDIVEELVGEIKDEYDVEADPLTVETDGSVIADGRASVERLEEALETELSLDEETTTVGGLVTSIFGQIPRPGERTSYRGFEVEVLAAEKKRVNRVRFRRVAVADPA
ncbi:MAG TPA: hemolysin family protein [Vicinamibacteria bacterium]|nr:hemolysin family protein [Vicinamibacteria bacterium]